MQNLYITQVRKYNIVLRISNRVLQATEGAQRPHSNSNLSASASFVPSPRTAGNAAAAQPPANGQFRGAAPAMAMPQNSSTGNMGMAFASQPHDPAQQSMGSASGLNVASQSFRPGQGRVDNFPTPQQQPHTQPPQQQPPQQQQPMYQPVSYVADENGNVSVAQPHHQMPHQGQPNFYMQGPQNATAVFVDQQSGQPVYYRVIPPGGMMHGEMYANAPGAVNADGTVPAGEEQPQQQQQQQQQQPQMMSFIPYGAPVPGQPGQQTPQQLQQMQMQQMQHMQMQQMQMANMGQYWNGEAGEQSGAPVGVYLPSDMTGSGRGLYVGGGNNGHAGQQGYPHSQSHPNLSMGNGGRNYNNRSGDLGLNNQDPEGMPLDELGLYGGHSSIGGGHESRPFGHKDNRDNRRGDYRGNPDDRNRKGPGGRGERNGGGAVNPMRDPLVDEFRATYGKGRTWELIDLIGHVVAFCQDQHGSRFIQQRLEVCTEVDKQLIFDEIVPSAHGLMTDVFGNYVLQKLFEYGSPDQCDSLAMLLTGQAAQLSMQMYGCRVVQKALEYVGTQRLIALVAEFENPQVLLRCVHDSNGNHVVQKCIEIVSKAAKDKANEKSSEYLSSRIQFIINAFQTRVKELSCHPYGCRVVQRILEFCTYSQKSVILEELRVCCSELVRDCYGNYVIQFVMQHGLEADRAVLIKEVQAHLLDFSQHKFASNVVEKCLQYANKRDRDEMIWTIINVTFDLNSPVDAKTGHCVLESMVRDPYANYVVQKVIDVSDERQRAAIMRYVRENISQLRRYTYGKHIIVRLEKITNEKF
jgi:hypothetical protein